MFVDVSKRMREPQIQEIFALAVGYPTPEKLEGLAHQYASEPTWSALALFDGAIPVGVLGLEMRSPGSAQIRYISVSPARQRSGVGRHLIEEIRRRESLMELYAETHSGAVPFYRQCGFEVTSLGELWPGVERFACWWRTA
jgi:N-acetylglutamate synthase-like GNAT family acetyltransferase